MKKSRLEAYTAGWVVGNFTPSAFPSEDFEFGVKYFLAGETEPAHFQRIAIEVSIVVQGECRIGTERMTSGDVLLIEPGEIADFEAISDCIIAVAKWPSLPADKVLA